MNMELETLKYPIGKFEYGKSYTIDEYRENISRIYRLPLEFSKWIKKIRPKDIEKSYRPGGWDARQILYHVGDSHINGYVRLRWTLSEHEPVVKTFQHEKWALQPNQAFDLDNGILLLEVINKKIAEVLAELNVDQLKRSYFHPGLQRHISIDELAAIYAWHGEHHLGHIRLIANDRVLA
jgi:hypothetical protein